MKILCIGDSLALPGHLNKYEDTWFYLLEKEFPDHDFISLFQRAATTYILVSMGGGMNGVDKVPSGADCLEFYYPDIVILQLGIVDCAPRYLRKKGSTYKIVRWMPNKLQELFYFFLRQIRERKDDYADVTPDEFFRNLNTYFQRCAKSGVKKVIIIEICKPDAEMVNKTPTIKKSIDQYNSIFYALKKKYPFIQTVDPLNYEVVSKKIFQDGYHPNQLGHQLVFQSLRKVLNHAQTS